MSSTSVETAPRAHGISRRGAYARLRETENDDPASDAAAQRRRERAETIERINTKIHALLWVGIAVATVYYTNLWNIVFSSDSKAVGWAVDIGFAAVGVVLSIMLYLVVYVRRVLRIDVDWAVYAPRMIPAATIAGVVAVFSFLIGLWPVFGLLTPLLLAVLFMGSIMAFHFVPSV